MKKIETLNAPKALGPYSQGIIINGMVYTSGQLGISPKDGSLPNTIEEQAEQAFLNIFGILEASGSDLSKVVKTTVFLTNLADFGVVNSIYEKYFTSCPARSCVEVSKLPKGALLEIEAIAVI